MPTARLVESRTLDQHQANFSITYVGPMSTNVEATSFVHVWPEMLLTECQIGSINYCYEDNATLYRVKNWTRKDRQIDEQVHEI